MMQHYDVYNLTSSGGAAATGYNVSTYVFNFSSLLLLPNGTNLPLCSEPGGGDGGGNNASTTVCVGSDGTPVIIISTFDILLGLFLSAFILCIVIGNCFVILSVVLFREMRTLTNGMIVSLATADLLVALIVLPVSLHFEIMDNIWTLGAVMCDFWTTADIFCCTASILNIVGIAVDRYWLITKNVRYTHSATFSRQRVCLMLSLCAWASSAVISSLPLLGWKSETDNVDPYTCMISQDLGYTIFSTFGAFWFPLSVILLVYAKIFHIARKRARLRSKQRSIHPSINNSTAFNNTEGQNGHSRKQRYRLPSESATPPESPGVPAAAEGGSVRGQAQSEHNNNTNGSVRFHEDIPEDGMSITQVGGSLRDGSIRSTTTIGTRAGSTRGGQQQNGGSASIRRQIGRGIARTYMRRHRAAGRRLASSRESRARERTRTRNSARTLGLIIGGFVMCWLPFFILATLVPFCDVCARNIPPAVHSVALWLGYSNSLLNPAIYAIWDKNFRRSFKRLAHCDIRWSMIL